MNLIKIENNDGLEFHIDAESNLAYASVRATERMLAISPGTLNMYFKTKEAAKLLPLKEAEVVTAQGMRTAKLFSSERVFQLALKYNIDLAAKMGAAGANVFMLGLAGYKVQVVEQEHQFQIPTTLAEALRLAADAIEERDAAHAKIEADAPKVALAELIEVRPESISLSNYAKSIERGRTTLYQQLRTMGILQATGSPQPYQRFIDAGYFSMSMSLYAPVPVTYVTPKGKAWLAKRLADFEAKQLAVVQIEREVEFAY
jgi:phage antirepressor YoqD-like protein